MTYPRQRTEHAESGTESERHVLLARIPFGQTPSLRPLRSRSLGVVRELRRYYRSVRLPVTVYHRRTSIDFPTRPAASSVAGGHGTSRFSREVFPYMHGGLDRAGFRPISRWRWTECGLPRTSTASAPRSKFLSRLDTRPVRIPVIASPLPLRATTHDSGPLWAANPSTYDSLHSQHLAGLSRRTEVGP